MKADGNLVRRGLLHHQSGEIDAAIESYRAALAQSQVNVDALHLLGLLMHEQGDNTQSVKLISKAISLRPEIAQMHNSLGVVHMATGENKLAAKSFQAAIARDPKLSEAHRNLQALSMNDHQAIEKASGFERVGSLEESCERLTRLVEGNPGDLDQVEELASLEAKLERFSLAIDRYEHIVSVDPTRRRSLLSMATLCERCGQVDRTVRTCVQILRVDPDSVAANLLLGMVLSSRLAPEHRANLDLAEIDGLKKRSLQHLRRAARLDPSPETFDALGRAMMQCGRHSEAIDMLKQSIELEPRFAASHENLGRALLEVGDLGAAQSHFSIAATLNPRSCNAHYELARLDQGDHKKTIKDLEFLLQQQGLSSQERMKLRFALARRLDLDGQHDAAFESYSLANDEKISNRKPRASDAIEVQVNHLIETFDQRYFRELPREESPTGPAKQLEPIFIVGMPRSGTTLVEQILASHPSVFGAGELSSISDIAQSLGRRLGIDCGYPESAASIDQEYAKTIKNEYLELLSQLAKNANCETATRVTDKMPTNFKHLGLIARLFPTARIVHMIRDPLDVCISCFKQNLDWPFCDLDAVADYYHQYQRLMEHWKGVLPLPIHDLCYEDLIKGQIRESERLIDFCNLPWDSDCLDFATSDRAVQTPSKWQVRQPIYNSSIGGWRKYEKHLPGLIGRFSVDENGADHC